LGMLKGELWAETSVMLENWREQNSG
jgi:hypothetical protein